MNPWRSFLRRSAALAFAASLVAFQSPASSAPDSTPPSNSPQLILAHYMPWFMAKPFSKSWGWHWTMNAFHPDQLSAGLPEIASHYHPLIGPYDSADPEVLEYHTLLMRLAGIDGVILDWYGREDLFDYAAIHRNSLLLVAQSAKAKLRFAACFEDQTIPSLIKNQRIAAGGRVEQARKEVEWLGENWFRSPAYVQLDGKPLLLSFGQDGLTDDEWTRVLKGSPGAPLYLSEHKRRSAASGAFDWPQPQVGLKAQDRFYRDAPGWPAGMAVAFPRFRDIYQEAKVHQRLGTIADDEGKTFQSTLERALRSHLPMVQISTWNDWGEGTVIEPSVEFGFRDLEVIQRLRKQLIEPGFQATSEDLRLPLRLYKLRKSTPGRLSMAGELDQISEQLANLSTKPAKAALDRLETPVRSGG